MLCSKLRKTLGSKIAAMMVRCSRNHARFFELIKRKIQDYTVEHYADRARDMRSRLVEIVSGTAFRNEMTRFLPTQTVDRTIRTPRFADFLAREVTAMLDQAILALEGPPPGSPSPEFTL